MRRLVLAGLLVLSACSIPNTATTPWRDVAGNPCETTKIWPNTLHYSAETVTTCLRDGKAENVPTQHTDLSMVAALGAVLAAIITII